jgi:hypothetical protein
MRSEDYVITLPALFLGDHCSRDHGPSIEWIRDGVRTSEIRISAADLANLYDDAGHYASAAMDEWGEGASVRRSAVRTAASIERQIPEIADLVARWRRGEVT